MQARMLNEYAEILKQYELKVSALDIGAEIKKSHLMVVHTLKFVHYHLEMIGLFIDLGPTRWANDWVCPLEATDRERGVLRDDAGVAFNIMMYADDGAAVISALQTIITNFINYSEIAAQNNLLIDWVGCIQRSCWAARIDMWVEPGFRLIQDKGLAKAATPSVSSSVLSPMVKTVAVVNAAGKIRSVMQELYVSLLKSVPVMQPKPSVNGNDMKVETKVTESKNDEETQKTLEKKVVKSKKRSNANTSSKKSKSKTKKAKRQPVSSSDSSNSDTDSDAKQKKKRKKKQSTQKKRRSHDQANKTNMINAVPALSPAPVQSVPVQLSNSAFFQARDLQEARAKWVKNKTTQLTAHLKALPNASLEAVGMWLNGFFTFKNNSTQPSATIVRPLVVPTANAGLAGLSSQQSSTPTKK